jgi:hypothetical protein
MLFALKLVIAGVSLEKYVSGFVIHPPQSSYAVSLMLLRFLICVAFRKIGELGLQHPKDVYGVVVGFDLKGDGVRMAEFVGIMVR